MIKYISLSLAILLSTALFGQLKESQSIDSLFSDWQEPNTPGCALGIISNGELLYAKGYGLANMEYDIPNSPSSVFRIGSTSKQFTAACIVLLEQQGKLDLDQSLSSIFPEFPEYADRITIKHLLNHTSGIRDYLQLAYLKGLRDDDYYTDSDLMSWLINQSDLNFEPGEDYLYSNSGYWLLGQIVKHISGKSMAEYAQEEIFEPLGMSSTHFHDDHTAIVPNRASGYSPTGTDGYQISMTTLDMIGDGGIFTSIEDIKKWDDAYYRSEVLDSEFWDGMTQQGILNNGDTIDYASGLIIKDYKGLSTIRHGGAFVGFRAELLRFPSERLSIAIFANRGDANPSELADQIADILLKDKLLVNTEDSEESVSIEEPTTMYSLTQVVGDYEIEPGMTLNISNKYDSLWVVQSWNQSSYHIVNTVGNTYQIPGFEGLSFTFRNLEENQTNELKIIQGTRPTLAKRKEPVDLSSINMEDYPGRYYSPELAVSYIFELVDDKLQSKIEGQPDLSDCSVVDKDQFAIQYGLVRFQRSNGIITGLELDSGRVKNVKFVKQD